MAVVEGHDGGTPRQAPDLGSPPPPPPRIPCPLAVTVPVDARTCGARLTEVQLGAVFVPAGYRVETINLPPGGLFPVGTTRIDCVIHGPGGELVLNCEQSVVVVDSAPPEFGPLTFDLSRLHRQRLRPPRAPQRLPLSRDRLTTIDSRRLNHDD